jgi:hypothetical protein
VIKGLTVNISQVSDNQIISILFCSLAMLKSPLSVEEKVTALEKVLMSRVLNSNQPLAVVQTGFDMFDEAALAYATSIEERLKALDVSKISTGSDILDEAVKERINALLESNFS